MGVMHTTSPQRAQRPDGTIPSVLDLMHQTQLQQVRHSITSCVPASRGDSSALQTASRQRQGCVPSQPSLCTQHQPHLQGSCNTAHLLACSCLQSTERFEPRQCLSQGP